MLITSLSALMRPLQLPLSIYLCLCPFAHEYLDCLMLDIPCKRRTYWVSIFDLSIFS